MCGRFTQTKELADLNERFGLTPAGPQVRPRYNLAPGQEAAVVIGQPPRLVMMRWGLVPPWADSPSFGYKTINARAETLAEKPVFAGPLRRGRCLVAADGFYEWQPGGKGRAKKPWWFGLPGRDLFAFAGLWETWAGEEDKKLLSFTIVTTQANDLIRPVHGRMPAILSPENELIWLDSGITDPKQVLSLLRSFPPNKMEGHPVSPLVNSAQNDSPECLRPAAPEKGLFDWPADGSS